MHEKFRDLSARSGYAGGHRQETGMLELFTSALVTFFVAIDPPGVAPIFAALTDGARAAAGGGASTSAERVLGQPGEGPGGVPSAASCSPAMPS